MDRTIVTASASTSSGGFWIDTVGVTGDEVRNSVVYGVSLDGLYANNDINPVLRNVTSAKNGGAGFNGYYTTFTCTNCLATGNAGGDFITTNRTPTVTYSASGDGTANTWGGAGNRTGQSFSFKDYDGNDFHLTSGDQGARDHGTSLGGSFTNDIDGETRSGTWDIGADELPEATPIIQVSSRSDTLSDSRPSVTSNHTIAFKVNSSLDTDSPTATDTLTLTLASGFNLNNIYCKDVDLSVGGTATSIAGTFADRATSKNCPGSATSWGLFIDPVATTITFYTPTGVRTWVAAGTQVQIKIGTNSTFQDTGTAQIVNPSTPGTYTVSVGGTFGGSGSIPVSINAGFEVAATIPEQLSFTVSPVSNTSLSHRKSDSGFCDSNDGLGVGNMSTPCSAGASSKSFTYTPTAVSDGILIAVGCAGSNTPTDVNLSASNWNFTRVGSIIGSSGNWLALFKAYSPNTSQAIITQSWTISGGCFNGGTTWMNDLIDEWSGVDSVDFVDMYNSGTGSGSCSLNVTPVSNNAGLNGFCQDTVSAVGGGFTKGADDTLQDWSEYKLLSGGAGVPQTINFTGSGTWESFAVAVKPKVPCTADDGASVTAVTSTDTAVHFDVDLMNHFFQGCHDLNVSTNAPGGYVLTAQETYAMRTAEGNYVIPDTTCDAGGCSESVAASWADPTKNGFGHTCYNQSMHDCDASYGTGADSGKYFRQFANIANAETVQPIMASSTPAIATGRVKYRLSVAPSQAAGTYTTIVDYIITATY